jgi:hypothetical protein
MTNSGDDDPKIGLSIIDPRFALIGLHGVRGAHFTRQSVKTDNWQSKARHRDVWYGSKSAGLIVGLRLPVFSYNRTLV